MRSRTRHWLLIAAVLLLLLAFSGRLVPKPEVDTVYFDVPKPMVIAHQGGDGLRPSNTLLAFEHAVELGVDVLEMDVHLTGDGALVLMHDATVDRTTDGTGALAAMPLAEVKALDAAYRWPYQGEEHPYRGRGVAVPTLTEVVERFPELRFNIEIKPDSPEAGRALCRELEGLGVTRRVLVASFHAAPIDVFRDTCPTVPTSTHASEAQWIYLLYRIRLLQLAAPRAAALQLPPRSGDFDLTDPAFIAALVDRRLHVDYWTINDPGDMLALVKGGAGGIITDRPDLLMEVLGRR